MIIEMNNNTTKIKDINSGEKKEFTFDYSFWSHDGFFIDENVLFLIYFINIYLFKGFYVKNSD
jgi:hypothetical protein